MTCARPGLSSSLGRYDRALAREPCGVADFDIRPLSWASADLERLSRIVASYPPGHSALFLSLTTSPRPERTPAMTTTTKTEYGFKYGSDAIDWPDGDGELKKPNSYDYIDASDLPALREAARTFNAIAPAARRLVIHSRKITTSEPSPVAEPLPTAVGSVIRATHPGGERGLFALTDDEDRAPWIRVTGSGMRYRAPESLTDVELVFDAGTSS